MTDLLYHVMFPDVLVCGGAITRLQAGDEGFFYKESGCIAFQRKGTSIKLHTGFCPTRDKHGDDKFLLAVELMPYWLEIKRLICLLTGLKGRIVLDGEEIKSFVLE